MILPMSRIGNASTPAYDAVVDLARVERELVTIMYILGMSTDNMSAEVFEDIMQQIKTTFPFLRLEDRNLASNDALKEVSVLMRTNVRRLWRYWQIARSVVDG